MEDDRIAKILSWLSGGRLPTNEQVAEVQGRLTELIPLATDEHEERLTEILDEQLRASIDGVDSAVDEVDQRLARIDAL